MYCTVLLFLSSSLVSDLGSLIQAMRAMQVVVAAGKVVVGALVPILVPVVGLVQVAVFLLLLLLAAVGAVLLCWRWGHLCCCWQQWGQCCSAGGGGISAAAGGGGGGSAVAMAGRGGNSAAAGGGGAALLLLLVAVGAALLLVAVGAALLLLVAVGQLCCWWRWGQLCCCWWRWGQLCCCWWRWGQLCCWWWWGAALLLLAADGRGAALHLTESIETKCKNLVLPFSFSASKVHYLAGELLLYMKSLYMCASCATILLVQFHPYITNWSTYS